MTVARPHVVAREPTDRSSPRGLSCWFAALSAGAVTGLLLAVRTRPDVDLWLHLRIGALLRSGQRFSAESDPLSLLADRPYVPTQWLSQVAMSTVHQAAGMAGIQTLRLVLVLALGAAVLAGTRVTANPTPALAATALTMFGASASWGERPQLAGMALLATTVWLWWRASARGIVPWAVVPLTWLWGMIHGTWLLGVVLGTAILAGGLLDRRWVGRARTFVAIVPLASVVVAVLTPLGPQALLEPFRVSSVARLTANEWQAPAPDNPLLLVVLASALVAVLGIVRSPRDPWTRAVTVVVGVALALWMVRTIAAGALVLAPALAQGLSSLRLPGRDRGRPEDPAAPVSFRREWRLWASAAAVALLISVWHLATTSFVAPVSARVSNALGALPDDTVLAVDGRAVGWVQWQHPDRRPLRDLRAEVYSTPVATAYEHFQEARPGWQAYADRQGITAVLADRSRPLDPALGTEPDWTVVAADREFRLWVRR